jgi:hypothetical protein
LGFAFVKCLRPSPTAAPHSQPTAPNSQQPTDAQAARAGAPLAEEQGVGDVEGDYVWDQEYAWSQLVRR